VPTWLGIRQSLKVPLRQPTLLSSLSPVIIAAALDRLILVLATVARLRLSFPRVRLLPALIADKWLEPFRVRYRESALYLAAFKADRRGHIIAATYVANRGSIAVSVNAVKRHSAAIRALSVQA
jgi:hypothetical protein